MAATSFYGTGKRKSSIARVRLKPGSGKIVINKKDLDDYFGRETSKMIVKQPLEITENIDKYDIFVLP
jgi:small subunit ribosomal protein S9